MGSIRFDINTDAVIRFSARLDTLSQNALSNAVRSTLNDAAFDTKRNVPLVAQQKFITRNKSFFKAFTSVNMANSRNINVMRSEIGVDGGKPNGQRVAKGLESQETGGEIGNRGLIPMTTARISSSLEKKVRKNFHLNKVKLKGGGDKGGKFVLLKKGGNGTLFQVKGKGKRSKLLPLYSYKKGRSVNVKRTNFMRDSSLLAMARMDRNFIKNAEYQIRRHFR